MNELDERRWRVYVLFAVIIGCVLVLVTKLIHIQVVQGDYYYSLAQSERWREEIVLPRRGSINDSSGNVLAASVTFESLHANTSHISDPARAAQLLSPILDEAPEVLESKLRTEQVAPLLIRRHLPAETADRIRELRLWNIYLKPEPRRSHPEGNLAAQLIGVVGIDNVGLSGLELAFNDHLAGTPGWLIAERDTGGEPIALSARQYLAPVDGADITLTLDRYIQRIAERELRAAISRHQAKGGTIIVLDPSTGAILAMASLPTFRFDDPDLFHPQTVPLYQIPGIADAYEPGSTFKVVSMAAALDAGAVSPDTTFHNEGLLHYAGGVVRNAVARPPEMESMAQTLERSSNIGAAYAATLLKADSFYRYLRAFGVGRLSGVDLPGESPGVLRLPEQREWHEFDLATNSFGQGLAMTPLQLTAAVAAVANGGTLMKPYIVSHTSGPEGQRTYHPTVVRQVISTETARTLTEMLVSTVDCIETGQVRLARIPGYSAAGKTGTAQIPTPQGYGSGTIASFVGFAPAEDPRFVILVRVDEPQDTPWGETVAAPIFRTMSEELLIYFRVAPSPERLALH